MMTVLTTRVQDINKILDWIDELKPGLRKEDQATFESIQWEGQLSRLVTISFLREYLPINNLSNRQIKENVTALLDAPLRAHYFNLTIFVMDLQDLIDLEEINLVEEYMGEIFSDFCAVVLGLDGASIEAFNLTKLASWMNIAPKNLIKRKTRTKTKTNNGTKRSNEDRQVKEDRDPTSK